MKDLPEKNSYTLLADDNVLLATEPSLRRHFKAHVILSVLTNSSLMFSDNQVINALNLRGLLREDETIRGLVSDHLLHFALRQGTVDHDGAQGDRLRTTQEAFKREEKLRDSPYNDDPFEFALIEGAGNVVDWPYRAVRDNYTTTCKRTLFSDATLRTFGDVAYRALQEAVSEEEAASEAGDRGLGRAFLQQRLPAELLRRGVTLTPTQLQHLINCIEAPYLSGLPTVLGRNPIYEPQHAASFELLRGQSYRYEDIEAPVTLPTRLDAEHFVEGLARLTVEDVHSLRESHEFKRYLELSARGVERFHEFQELRTAFAALNIRIDDGIITRFPELKRTNKPTAREIKSRVAILNHSSNAVLDILGFFVPVPGGVSTAFALLVDFVRDRYGVGDSTLSIQADAERKVALQDLRDVLKRSGLDHKIEASEDLVTTDSYASETIVVA